MELYGVVYYNKKKRSYAISLTSAKSFYEAENIAKKDMKKNWGSDYELYNVFHLDKKKVMAGEVVHIIES